LSAAALSGTGFYKMQPVCSLINPVLTFKTMSYSIIVSGGDPESDLTDDSAY